MLLARCWPAMMGHFASRTPMPCRGSPSLGPETLPAILIIDCQTKSTRPALKETIGRKLIAEGMEAGNITPAEAVD